MDMKTLQDTPPWDWPRDARKRIQEVLIDRRANESDRLIAAELAGDLIVMDDKMAAKLMAIIRSDDEPDGLRARSATSLGPILEQADIDEFEDPDDLRIAQSTFLNIQKLLQELYSDSTVPKESGGGFWKHRCALHRTGTTRRSAQRIPAETETGY